MSARPTAAHWSSAVALPRTPSSRASLPLAQPCGISDHASLEALHAAGPAARACTTGPGAASVGMAEVDGPRPLAAEAAGPELVGAQCTQEVDLAESRPVGLAELELRVDRLPGQEAGQANLARCPDDQVRLGRAAGVEVVGDRFGGQFVGQPVGRDTRLGGGPDG